MTPIEQLQAQIRNSETGHLRFFPNQMFPWVSEVEEHHKEIRNETDRLLNAIDALPGFEEIQEEQRALTHDKRWKVFPFNAYGHRIAANEARCPHTAKALAKIPGLKTAMFSILQPGKEIPPHCGPYNGVLRYHLGIKVPQGCGIEVGGETGHWQEGKSLIFDDSHLHKAWNRSDKDRVVLFVDFERPFLPAPLAQMNRQAIDFIGRTEFITKVVLKWDEWERRYGETLDGLLAASN